MSAPRTADAESSPRRIPWWPLGIVVFMLTFALFGDRGLVYLSRQKGHQAELEKQLAEVEEVNAGLRREISSLTADRRHLERLARSQLGLVREDEVVYQFSAPTRAPLSVPATHPAAASR